MLASIPLLGLGAFVAAFTVGGTAKAQAVSYDADHPPPAFDEPASSRAAPPALDQPEAPGDLAYDARSRGEFGGYFMLVPGVEGKLANGGVGVSIGPAVAVGKRIRYHAALGFMHIGGLSAAYSTSVSSNPDCGTDAYGYYQGDCTSTKAMGTNGFALDAATLGVPIAITEGSVGFAVEPVVQVLEWDLLFGDETMMMWQTGFGVQAVLNYGSFFAAARPFAAQFRYLVFRSGEFDSGIGVNWPVRLDAGLRF